MKKALWLTVTAVLAALSMVAYASAQGKPSYGCSAGFDHHVTTEAAAALPRSAQAIEDGLISEADLIAGYQTIDKNGNNMLCVKEVAGWEPGLAQKPLAEYFYNFTDDNSSS